MRAFWEETKGILEEERRAMRGWSWPSVKASLAGSVMVSFLFSADVVLAREQSYAQREGREEGGEAGERGVEEDWDGSDG